MANPINSAELYTKPQVDKLIANLQQGGGAGGGARSIVLGASDPIPDGTPPGTIIVRTQA